MTEGAWDADVVASMNILPDPTKPGGWLAYYEGGMGNGTGGKWSLGLARADSPLGPYRKDPRNPILSGAAVCDARREFDSVCNGLYVAAVTRGAHTNGEYWRLYEYRTGAY